LAAFGCASRNETITRVGPNEVIDINSQFNQNDARELARQSCDDLLAKPWIDRWLREHGGQTPKIVLGMVKNKTSDYTIDTAMATDAIQRELLNSGRVRVFAAREIREQLRSERFDTEFADPATVKAAASEIKADFMLLGDLRERTQVSGDGRSKVVYFEMGLEMTDMATTEKYFINIAKVQKTSAR
jgi:PBP1b-binding outer membrane lipoprotein LpoB